MSLATRLSAFFLLALALVLAAFSVTLYQLASRHLYSQLDERLTTALDTLEASIDVEPGGLEWEPQDRRILLGTETDPDDVRWQVTTLAGVVVDRSTNHAAEFPADWRPEAWPSDPPDGTTLGQAGSWRMASRRLLLEDLLRLGRGHPEDDGPENDIEYPALLLTAGVSQLPLQATLSQLIWALAGTSVAAWLVSAVVGRWLSRRALAPVANMAAAANRMTASTQGRLPLAGTGDELDELGQAFNELLARLHDALERQRRFAGEASHQLRTPLAGMLSLVEVTRRRPRDADEYRTALDQLQPEIERMRQIVEALLFLARSEADTSPPELERIDLRTWVAEQTRHRGDRARWDDLQIEVPDVAVTIQANAALLAQLFGNLLDNALKYSLRGTPVRVSVWHERQAAGFDVEDEGLGIAAEDLPQLFKPFFRGDDARRHTAGGSGLGLAVAARIAESLGASIDVQSTPGRGSRFRVAFRGLLEQAFSPPAARRPVEPV